jgi:hypothetical protein
MKTTTLVLALGLAAVAAPAAAGGLSADDDLAVVKKATASSENGSRMPAEAEPRSRADEPRWLRVRIVETGEKKATVKVNLPLALVHALGDDIPVPGCGGHGGKGLTVGEVLRALDTGESLVEIEDAGSTVRIWVE